jgi:hypothetical protein
MESYDFSPNKLFKEVTIEEYMLFLTYALEYRALVMEQLSQEAEQRYIEQHPREEDRADGYGVVLLSCFIRDLKGARDTILPLNHLFHCFSCRRSGT